MVSKILFDKKIKNKNFLDYGGGIGLLTALMRNIGFNFFSYDKYQVNLLSSFFNFDKNKEYEFSTAFECLEHFTNPVQDFDMIFKHSNNLICSTEIMNIPPPNLQDWWYYLPAGGQHISFYSLKTLEFLAKKYSKILITDNKKYHLFIDKEFNNLDITKIKLRLKFLPFFLIKIFMKSLTNNDINLVFNNYFKGNTHDTK